MRTWIVLLGLLLISIPTLAQKRDANSQKAYTTLKTAHYFALGGVGFAGTTSEGENALRILLKPKDAVPLFQKLLKEANREGQLYALLGLRLTNPTVFAREVTPFLSMQAKAHTMSGCIASDQPVATITQTIKKGDYDKVVKKETPR
jgi:hypothetical protein